MKIQKRRKRERKTDYLKRLKLLKSRTPRLVFRKTNKYILAQYVIDEQAQDKVQMGISSKELIKFGWPKEFQGSLKSIPAAYLTGFLIGKKLINKKLETPIIDLGMLRTVHKTKVHAFAKGVVDAGVGIKYKEETFPIEDRIKGTHLKKDFSKSFDEIKSKIEKL
ncbi:50S ribosomal protein L18 [Candidatus Pacearchaeota archaeon]|nr:50S ribosomal protein L18 [Candidatus Pacearchaeota archaeon]